MTQQLIYVREFEQPTSRGYRRVMGHAIGQKIKNMRIAMGLTQGELAARLGTTQASVSRWEKGSMPEADKLAQLADLQGESVREFIDDKASGETIPLVLNRFWVRGAVAAGVFAPAYEWPEDEWKSYSGMADLDVPQEARFGLEVKGESMNLVYPPGTILDCVSIDAVGEIASGKRVIVERTCLTGEVEATVKEYVVVDGVEWLVPRSTNPAFQAPISATEPGEGITEVKIIAVVVGSYRPE